MAPKNTSPKPRPTSTVIDTSGLPRRDFLRLGLGGAALLAGCGDDTLGTSETEGSSTGDDETTSTSGLPETTGDETTTTGSTGTGTDSEGTTVDPTTTDATTTTDGTTTDPTDGGDPCDGEVITFDPEAVPLDEILFPLAVMAGEMKPTSAMLAVFIADAAPKLLRIWRPGDQPGTVKLILEEEVVPDADGYMKVSVEGLCPGTWYRYGYFVGEPDDFTARSLLAEFRTAIDTETLEAVTIAISACNGSSLDWPALELTADEYYDAFIHLGDMAYNDGAYTLQEFRTSWRKYMAASGFKRAFGRAGLYATWDDHEIDDNSGFDRETMDPAELLRRQNAMDAYFELLPIDAEGPDYRLWRSFRWGRTCEFIVLDCRYERRPSIEQYISPEQMAFLKDRLLNSPCQFKVIVNSVPITNMPLIWDVASGDRWEGFPGQRSELLNFIDDHQLDNVWFISGDFHVSFVSRIEPDGLKISDRTREIAISGGNENPLPEWVGNLSPPQFDYGRHKARGCLLTFDPTSNKVGVRLIDPNTGEDDYFEWLTSPG